MAVAKTYYEILGIAKDANAEDINKAYRKLSLQYHPDRNPGDAEALEKFKEVNDANGILGDEAKRREYDRTPTEAVSAHDVAYFKSRPDYARLTLREFQERGYIEFADTEVSPKTLNSDGRLYVHLHCKASQGIPSWALEEFGNALTALDARDVVISTSASKNRTFIVPDDERLAEEKRQEQANESRNPDDKVIVSFNIKDRPPRNVSHLVELIDSYWNDLFFKRPTDSDRLLEGATAASFARPAATQCKYFLTKSCVMAGLDNICKQRTQADKQVYNEVIEPAKHTLRWQLAGREGSSLKYATVDLWQAPPLAGFDGVPQELLRKYYQCVLTSATDKDFFYSDIFQPIDIRTGESLPDSQHYAIIDQKYYKQLRKAGLIPEEVAAEVNFKGAGQPAPSYEQKFTRFKNEIERLAKSWKRYPELASLNNSNSAQVLRENIRWTLAGPKDSGALYAVADFSQVAPLEEFPLRAEILKIYYKELLGRHLRDKEQTADILAKILSPINPDTGEPQRSGDYYAVVNAAAFENLKRDGIIPKDIADQVRFTNSAEQLSLRTPEEINSKQVELGNKYTRLITDMSSHPHWRDKNNIVQALKDGIRWKLKGPIHTNIKYATADFSDLPPLAGFETLPPEVLRMFYEYQLTDSIPDKLHKDLCYIGPNTGEKMDSSDHLAIMSPVLLQHLKDIIPPDIAAGVNFTNTLRPKPVPKTRKEIAGIRKQFESIKNKMGQDGHWDQPSNIVQAVKDAGIIWKIVTSEKTGLKYPVADFSNLQPLMGFNDVPQDVLQMVYKDLLDRALFKCHVTLHKYNPVDPDTGGPVDQSDHYMITSPKIYNALLGLKLIPPDIAKEIDFLHTPSKPKGPQMPGGGIRDRR